MEVPNIAKSNGFDVDDFTKWLFENGFSVTKKFLQAAILSDSEIETAIQGYTAYQAEREACQAEREAAQAAQAGMLISSGFSFDGYRITKYSGYISGDDAAFYATGNLVQSEDIETCQKELCETLVRIRQQAIRELKEAAYNLGCNAVVGVDFDYMIVDGPNTNSRNHLICVTANGNAVVVERE